MRSRAAAGNIPTRKRQIRSPWASMKKVADQAIRVPARKSIAVAPTVRAPLVSRLELVRNDSRSWVRYSLS